MHVTAAPLTLSPLETATSIVVGPTAAPALARRATGSPMAALMHVLRAALDQPPCVVAFSGGRDSSALLAIAVRVAREHGLAPPVPATLRFPGAERAAEDEWQEMMVERLGCADWIRLEYDDGLDLVGPAAQRVMEWDGQPFPYNLHLLLPLMEAAHGGTLVTGVGGDQVMIASGRELDVLARRRRPVPRDGLRIAARAVPEALRRSVLRGRVGLTFPWLTADGNEALTAAWLTEEARLPLRWDSRLRTMWHARVTQLVLMRMASLADRVGVRAVHPFLEPRFVAALGAMGGPTGFPDRSAALRALFGHALPDAVVTRGTKASFNEVLWHRHTRHLVADLDESRVERTLRCLSLEGLVDPTALLAHWRGDEPLANSFLLLQACRLADPA
jgi:asparagine synthetase B (glutamine-hydrolysing)